jgi:hypothetical protein
MPKPIDARLRTLTRSTQVQKCTCGAKGECPRCLQLTLLIDIRVALASIARVLGKSFAEGYTAGLEEGQLEPDDRKGMTHAWSNSTTSSYIS